MSNRCRPGGETHGKDLLAKKQAGQPCMKGQNCLPDRQGKDSRLVPKNCAVEKRPGFIRKLQNCNRTEGARQRIYVCDFNPHDGDGG